jgi:O-antigen/teichoic acid export membrane protein
VALVGNAVSLTSARLAAKGLAFLASILVARHLGRVAYGEYSVIISFTLIFSYLGDFGLVSLLIREVAARPAEIPQLLGDALVGQLMVASATVVALLLFGFALEMGATLRLGLALAAIGLFIECLGRPFSGVVIGQKRIVPAALIIAIASIVNTVLILAVLTIHPTLIALIAVTIPVGCIGLALPSMLCLHWAGLPRRPHLRHAGGLLRLSFPFAVLMGSTVLYDRIDVLMLSHLANNGATGVYAAADRVTEGLLVLPASIGASLYPTLSADKAQAAERVRDTLIWALPIGAIVSIFCITLGAPLVAVLYGPHYVGVADAFRLLSPTILLEMATVPLAYLLQAQVRTQRAIVATLIGLGTDIGLNTILIPHFSYDGAATSATLAELVVLAALLVAIKERSATS